MIYLFGIPQVILNQENLKISRRKSRAMLYYLAAHSRPVSRQQLLAIFWPDLPRQAAQQTLRTTLYELHKALGTNLIVEDDQVGLAMDVWVDARRFGARMNSTDISFEPEREILELYRGEFLEGLSLVETQPFEDWLTIERERYRRLAVRGLSALASAYERRGDYAAALECLERALAFNPLQEDIQRESIRLLYLAGDRPGAIRRYDELRRLLDDEMGVPPMIETRALYDAIITDQLPVPLATHQPPPTRPLPVHPAAAAGSGRSGELPFTGRSAELQAIRAALDDSRLVVVEGEAGIGKTRLVDEYLRTSSAIPLLGRGRELEQSLPYHAIIEALRCLTWRPEWPALLTKLAADLLPIWLAEVSRLIPELDAHLPNKPLVVQPANETRLWEGVRQFLAAVAQQYPLVVFLDDAHWADASSLALLGYLARQSGSENRGFIATARPLSRMGKRSPWTAFLQALVREDRLSTISLGRMELADVRQIASHLSPAFAEPLADWLWRMCEGNPYILVELVRYARQNQILTEEGVVNLNALSASPVVPQTVYSLLESRLGRLSDAARRVFDAAVAAGRKFEFDVTARAAGLSETAALDALDELQASGLVTALDVGRYYIDHPLTMEVAYRQVGELRHRLMHRRVAEAMENLRLERLEKTAGQLAYHFSEGNDIRRAAHYALMAGQQAIHVAAWSEAIGFFEMALKGLTGKQKLTTLIDLGEAHAKAGHYVQSSDTLRQALALVLSTPDYADQSGAVRLTLARSLLPQARFAEVINLAQEINEASTPTNRVTAELLWGTALAMEGLYLTDAESHLRNAQSLWQAGALEDHSILSQIQFELGNVAAQLGDLAQAVVWYREALQTATREQSSWATDQEILAYNNLAYHLHLMGDPTAVEYAQTGLKLAQEQGILGIQTYLYSTLGEIALDNGELGQAEGYFNNSLALAEQFAVAERVAGVKANLGRLAARRGQTSLAIYQLSTALGLADALGTLHLATQVRLWLAPLLPADEGRQRLLEARKIAESSGRTRLLEAVINLDSQLALKDG